MIRAKARIKADFKKVRQRAKAGSIQSLGKAGAYIRGIAAKSIKVSPEFSAPGHQPHSRKGRLKKSILFAVESSRENVVIGPTDSDVGKIGHTHEFGGTEPPKKKTGRKNNWKLEVGGFGPLRMNGNKPIIGKLLTAQQVTRAKQLAQSIPQSQGGMGGANKARKYPARPFMGPALMIARERLPKLWTNSVKG